MLIFLYKVFDVITVNYLDFIHVNGRARGDVNSLFLHKLSSVLKLALFWLKLQGFRILVASCRITVIAVFPLIYIAHRVGDIFPLANLRLSNQCALPTIIKYKLWRERAPILLNRWASHHLHIQLGALFFFSCWRLIDLAALTTYGFLDHSETWMFRFWWDMKLLQQIFWVSGYFGRAS